MLLRMKYKPLTKLYVITYDLPFKKLNKMTRETFIKKWLGNLDHEYTEQNRDLMREDLDKVINQVLRKGISMGLGSQGIWTPELEDVIFNEIINNTLPINEVVDISEQLKSFLDYVDIRYSQKGTRDKIVAEFLSLEKVS